jgi:hypothetical protein
MSPGSEVSSPEFAVPSDDFEDSSTEEDHHRKPSIPGRTSSVSEQLHPSTQDEPGLSPSISSHSGIPQISASGKSRPSTKSRTAKERADLIKKQHKLARIFGQPPRQAALTQENRLSNRKTTQTHRYGHQRSASVSSQSPSSIRPNFDGAQYLFANVRRHSTALSPEEFNFVERPTLAEDASLSGIPPGSPTSFMDLSDEEDVMTDISSIISSPKKRRRRNAASISLSSPSLLEMLTPEEQAEEDRRRKREKLAKVHRFLGSRVPEDLVLGIGKLLPTPGAAESELTPSTPMPENDADSPRKWLRRRRSRSVTDIRDNWSDHQDRIKEDLDGREKAINVRRAHKMEKVCI